MAKPDTVKRIRGCSGNILADTQTLYRRLMKSTAPKLSLFVMSIRFFELDCYKAIS